MCNARLLRWIGEAEARQVLVDAISEAPSGVCPTVGDGRQGWFGQLRRWVSADLRNKSGSGTAAPIPLGLNNRPLH